MSDEKAVFTLQGYAIVVACINNEVKVYGASTTPNGTAEPSDEVKEMNGKSVRNMEYHELIDYLHQCIRSKTIRLRVKRLGKQLSAFDVHSIRNTYVVANDQQAKLSISKSPALQHVRPVDMTKLSAVLQQSQTPPSSPQTLLRSSTVLLSTENLALSSSKLYADPFTCSSPLSEQQQSSDSTPFFADSPVQQLVPPETDILNQLAETGSIVEEQPASVVHTAQQSEGPQLDVEANVCTGTPCALPTSGSVGLVATFVNTEAAGCPLSTENSPSVADTMAVVPSSSNSNGYFQASTSVPGAYSGAHGDAGRFQSSSFEGNNGSFDFLHSGATGWNNRATPSVGSDDLIDDDGQEMAVDVPAGFIEQHKEPPRLPSSMRSAVMGNGKASPKGFAAVGKQKSHQKLGSDSSTTSATSRSYDQTVPNGGYDLSGPTQNPKHPALSSTSMGHLSSPTNSPPLQTGDNTSVQRHPNQAAEIRQRQESWRREQQERQKAQREQEMLRNSLRDSERLRSLRRQQRAAAAKKASSSVEGVENAAFQQELPSPHGGHPAEAEHSEGPHSPPISGGMAAHQLSPGRPSTVSTKLMDIDQVFSTLHDLRKILTSPEDQQCIMQLVQIFKDPKFHRALQLQNQLMQVRSQPERLAPAHSSAVQLTEQILADLKQAMSAPGVGARGGLGGLGGLGSDSEHSLSSGLGSASIAVDDRARVTELHRLLSRPVIIDGVLLAHDLIADKCVAAAPPLQEEEELEHKARTYNRPNLKIVRLVKTSDYPLGATIRNGPDGNQILIGRIVRGGAAEQSGLLHVGDEILEVNGQVVRGLDINEVCDMLISMSGPLSFLVVPAQVSVTGLGTHTSGATLDSTGSPNVIANGATPSPLPFFEPPQTRHLRALFKYDPDADPYIPCRELGVSFDKGDILHVVDDRDENWWQAFKDSDDSQQLAGLIPSRAFQEKREACRALIAGDDRQYHGATLSRSAGGKKASGASKSGSSGLCARMRHGRAKRHGTLYADDPDADDEILTYEEVAQYFPQPNRKRPLVLVGPNFVGRPELLKRLIDSDSSRFATALPHTTRPPRRDEQIGLKYQFVSREQFEQDIRDGKFVEHGQYQKEWYGTSIDAVRLVIHEGKICVLAVEPQALRLLRRPDIKPYIVFIRPPSVTTLKAYHQKLGNKLTDDQIADVIDKSREIEDRFGHLCDLQLVNFDDDRALSELLQEMHRLEVEPQWVPLDWVN